MEKLENKRVRICGTKEDRINRFQRMCLEWQYDLSHGVVRPSQYYFVAYNVGKYSKKYFSNISNVIVERNYVIRLMEKISKDRLEYDERKRQENK